MRWRAGLVAAVVVLAVIIMMAALQSSQQGAGSAGTGSDERSAGDPSPRSAPAPGDRETMVQAPTPAPEASRPAAEPAPAGPRPLLPNLRSQPAFDVRLERTAAGRRLRFSAGLANTGEGPVDVRRTRRGSCPRGQQLAQQVIYGDRDDDDRYRRRVDGPLDRHRAGCMLDHPTHDHWHFDAMAAYALRRPGTAYSLLSRDKVSFCLRDNRRVPRSAGRTPKRYYGECTRNSGQGISPGWADVYRFDLDGQWLPIPDSISGEVVCLDLAADPRGLLRESNETDNSSSVPVLIGAKATIVDSDLCRWPEGLDRLRR